MHSIERHSISTNRYIFLFNILLMCILNDMIDFSYRDTTMGELKLSPDEQSE